MAQLSKTTKIILDVSPEELAKLFWAMDEDDQAKFFNKLAIEALANGSNALQLQLWSVGKSSKLNATGKEVMQIIGEYAK